MYVLVTGDTATYYTVTDLRRDNPDVSFPVPTPDSTLAEFNVFPCAETTPPAVDYTQNLTMGAPVCIAGAWEQTWSVTPATPEEIAAREAAMRHANKEQASTLLSESDYTDLPNTANQIDNLPAILLYREKLRIIAINPPMTVDVWPDRPATVWKYTV
jgi:hypothetical protein